MTLNKLGDLNSNNQFDSSLHITKHILEVQKMVQSLTQNEIKYLEKKWWKYRI